MALGRTRLPRVCGTPASGWHRGLLICPAGFNGGSGLLQREREHGSISAPAIWNVKRKIQQNFLGNVINTTVCVRSASRRSNCLNAAVANVGRVRFDPEKTSG